MSSHPGLRNFLESPLSTYSDNAWAEALQGRAGLGADPGFEALLSALDEAAAEPNTVASRIARVAVHPLDQLILAALYSEGQSIALRQTLRQGGGEVRYVTHDVDGNQERVGALACTSLVRWLAGSDADLQQAVGARLLPQTGISAARLVQRTEASTPLDGGVRLTPFLASLLYPGDGQDERRLDESLTLVRPKQRLDQVVLPPEAQKELQAFLQLCRSHPGPGRAILLWGRAGTGKTLTARALAGELGLPLLLVRTQGLDAESGLIERAAVAARIEGAALFFDECGRWVDSTSQRHGPPPEAAMLLQMLQEHPGVVMAAMNQPWLSLSEAFQRRFQAQVAFGRSSPEDRVRLWRLHLKRPVAEAVLAPVAEFYAINGGLIANAAARLDSQAEGPVGLMELERVVHSQLQHQVAWNDKPRAFRVARDGLLRKTRLQLAELGFAMRRGPQGLPLGERLRQGRQHGKVLLLAHGTEDHYSAAYLARACGRAYQSLSLHEITAETGRESTMTGALLRAATEVCWRHGGFPVLALDDLERLKGRDGADKLNNFCLARGFGALLVRKTSVAREALEDFYGPWVRCEGSREPSWDQVALDGATYRLEARLADLERQVQGLNLDQRMNLAFWALTLQRRGKPDAPPGVILAAYQAQAAAYLMPGAGPPLF